jgi:hypothetical protein
MTNRLLAFIVVLTLAGCATVEKVERGQQSVGDRLVVDLEGPWNRFANVGPAGTPTWTVDGFQVDRLQFFVGIKDGTDLAAVATGGKDQRPLVFNAQMQPHEIVALYETLLTRDGSTFKLERLEPVQFLNGPGFRFSYLLTRRTDDVRLAGMGYAAVRQTELFAIVYSAPRLGFFPRYEKQVEKMALTARLK